MGVLFNWFIGKKTKLSLKISLQQQLYKRNTYNHERGELDMKQSTIVKETTIQVLRNRV